MTAGRGWLRWSGIPRARIPIGLLVAVLLSVGTSHAFAADPYVVYTANQQVNGAVILRSEPATGATVEISRNGPLGTLFQRPYDLAVEADGGLVVADMGTPDQERRGGHPRRSGDRASEPRVGARGGARQPL